MTNDSILKELIKWNALADVFIRLPKDDIGYPPKDWERLKGELTDVKDVHRLCNIPFYAKGLALGDEVFAPCIPEDDYSPVLQSMRKRSGYSTVRLGIAATEDRKALTDEFIGLGCKLEFCREMPSLAAVAIPGETFETTYAYLLSQKKAGRWDAEDGFILLDEDESLRTNANQ